MSESTETLLENNLQWAQDVKNLKPASRTTVFSYQ